MVLQLSLHALSPAHHKKHQRKGVLPRLPLLSPSPETHMGSSEKGKTCAQARHLQHAQIFSLIFTHPQSGKTFSHTSHCGHHQSVHHTWLPVRCELSISPLWSCVGPHSLQCRLSKHPAEPPHSSNLALCLHKVSSHLQVLGHEFLGPP